MEKKSIDEEAFLEGMTVYLRSPDLEKDVLNGRWFAWFNDKQVTKYLGQGAYPNTRAKQIEFVEGLKHDKTRVVLCIIVKSTQQHIGVISLNNIDLLNRKAEISIVMGENRYPVEAALESMALMTEYGFERLNLNKIDAGQAEGLWKWVNTLALIGYRIEGYQEAILIRDGKVHNGAHTGITAERFYKLRAERGGNICTDNLFELLAKRQKENVMEKIRLYLNDLYSRPIGQG